MKIWNCALIFNFLFFKQVAGHILGWKDHSNIVDPRPVNQVLNASLSIFPKEEDTEVYKNVTFKLQFKGWIPSCVNLTWESEPRVISTLPQEQDRLCPDVPDATSFDYVIEIFHEGIVTLIVEAKPPDLISTEDAFISISAMLNPSLAIFSDFCGWIYTIAWDFSFLPQIIHNWRRKSVIGMSFDYTAYNFLGFSSYFVFNAGMFWSEEIQRQFKEMNPNTIIHVRINDVMFPLYAVICTSVVIVQCFIYESGKQKVSLACKLIISLLFLSELANLLLVYLLEDVWMLDFFFWCSYVKLVITVIKYPPQLYMNYKHKSTEGWSIWNVFLDFTGGFFSILQMSLLALNYDDWNSIFLDPTKFGLGIITIFFNIIFIIQHYVIYRNSPSQQQTPTEDTPICTSSKSKYNE